MEVKRKADVAQLCQSRIPPWSLNMLWDGWLRSLSRWQSSTITTSTSWPTYTNEKNESLPSTLHSRLVPPPVKSQEIKHNPNTTLTSSENAWTFERDERNSSWTTFISLLKSDKVGTAKCIWLDIRRRIKWLRWRRWRNVLWQKWMKYALFLSPLFSSRS